ncbi:MAG TPA: DUF898 family protein [Pseudomonadales bacterium]|nr:DUF898 family protein [Pseudomonadales bacterium]
MGSYQIVYNNIMLAMDKQEAVEAFSRLFKLPPEKAAAILATPKTVIRSNLDAASAELYRKKLMAIGLDVDVRDTSVTTSFLTSTNPSPVISSKSLTLSDDGVYSEEGGARYHGNRTLDFSFNGSGSEYFRIWIVNVCLMVLTAGVYSVWAVARTRQYFYANTTLDNMPFQYITAPLKILSGYMVGVTVLLVYAGLLVLPVAPAIYSLPLLLLFPLLLVWFYCRKLPFIVWRNVSFDFTRDVSEAYKIALLPTMLLGGIFFGLSVSGGLHSLNTLNSKMLLAGMLFFCLGFPYWQYSLNRFFIHHASYGDEYFQFAPSVAAYYKLYFFKLPALLLLLMLLALLMVLAVIGAGWEQQLVALQSWWHSTTAGVTVSPEASTLMVVGVAACWLAAGLCWVVAYARASVINLRYQGMALGKSQLGCDVHTMPLLWLYLSNAVAILLTAGLFIPWARVRVIRYRLSCLSLFASFELDDIVNTAQRKRLQANR